MLPPHLSRLQNLLPGIEEKHHALDGENF